MRTKRNLLTKTRHLSTAPLDLLFMQWLTGALRDDAWRAFLRERLRQQELPVIQIEPTASR